MRKREKMRDNKEKISISLKKSLINKMDIFLNDDGLKEAGVSRSEVVEDVLNYIFEDFEKKGKKSILEKLFPED